MSVLTYHVTIAVNKTLIWSKSFYHRYRLHISHIIFTFHRDISRRDKWHDIFYLISYLYWYILISFYNATIFWRLCSNFIVKLRRFVRIELISLLIMTKMFKDYNIKDDMLKIIISIYWHIGKRIIVLKKFATILYKIFSVINILIREIYF